MLDRSRIGHRFSPFTVTLDAVRLRRFARAIGETRPEYTDEAAARRAGYRSLPMPPTFAFSLGKDAPDPNDALALFGVDFSRVLHGEQSFTFHSIPCAGDALTGRKRVIDLYGKKEGELEFIVLETEFTGDGGRPVCEAVQTIIVRSGA